MDSSLIASRPSIAVSPELTAERTKVLVVPRPVRDYIRSHLERARLIEINELAAGLYFGDRWREGGIKESLIAKLKKPTASAEEIQNGGTIAVRCSTTAWKLMMSGVSEAQ